MDYYSKYLKYKLKYKNLHKQIGGAIIWEYQSDDGAWHPYDLEEIWFIERHEGTFQLPISKFVVNKIELYQQGKRNRRTIRRREINNNEMRRLNTESQVRKTIAILQAFPQILRLDANMDSRLFENECMGIFRTNEHAFRRITAQPLDQYAAQHSDLYREIIRSRTQLNINDMTRLFEERRVRVEEERRSQRAIEAEEREKERTWEGYPGSHF
jgi:hypothetical protein